MAEEKIPSTDLQDRIRELAYLMWESAGRQHGMATQYWLSAEREVMAVMQSAASVLVPGAEDNKAKPKRAPRKKAGESTGDDGQGEAPDKAGAAVAAEEAKPAKTARASTAGKSEKATAKPAAKRTTRKKAEAS